MRSLASLIGSAALIGCSYGKLPDRRTDFVLFYPPDATALDAPATAIVARAAAAALRAPDLDIVVAGYEDAPATPESNQIRSRIRAQTVANALAERGVVPGRIKLTPRRALGADPAAESLRVEVRVGS